MTPEDEKRVKELILQKLSEWSLDLSKYDPLPLIKNEYTGSYELQLKHKPTGRTWKIPHIFVNEQTSEVAWNNIEMSQMG